MIRQRIALVFSLLALLTASVSAAKDSESQALPGRGMMPPVAFSLTHDILVEATGLETQELRSALMDGATVAELIEANDGDVDAVVAAVVAQMTTDINEMVTANLEDLEERVTEELKSSAEPRGFWGRWQRMPRILGNMGVADAVMEATGLEATDLRAALMDGSTIAELVDANEGDLETLTADILAAMTEAAHAMAAERIDSLDENVSSAFDMSFAEGKRRKGGPRHPGSRGFFGAWGFWGAAHSADSANSATAEG